MRLITRANLDGISCAVLISTMEIVEQFIFANSKEIEDGSLFLRPGDGLANLPYHPRASLWFDHHIGAIEAPEETAKVRGKRGASPSSARLVYEFYADPRLERFEELLSETDRIDSANFTLEDILHPGKWTLLSYTMDPYDIAPAYHAYLITLIEWLKAGKTIEDILDMKDVKARINRYFLDADDFRTELQRVTHLEGNVIVTDYRQVDLLPIGNRHLAFALFPQSNVQIRIYPETQNSQIRIRLGKSPLNRNLSINLGKLATEYGGSGLDGAAGFLLEIDTAEEKLKELIQRLQK